MDLTDAQWAVLEPTFRPRRRPDGRGRPWTDPRAVVNGVLWVLRTGAPWHDLPRRYPPYQTCHRRFQQWQRSGRLDRLLQYVIHWYVLHLTAIAFAWVRYGRIDFLFALPPALSPTPPDYPAGYGYDLWVVYLVWMLIVLALYPLCRWFAGVKARRPSPLLNYL